MIRKITPNVTLEWSVLRLAQITKAKPRNTLGKRALELVVAHHLKLARPADLAALDPLAIQTPFSLIAEMARHRFMRLRRGRCRLKGG
jgi:hypothetical protein